MAEVTGLRNNALPYPIYGAPFGIVFPMLDADGDLVTGASTPDAEISKNGDTFGDCTNESTEIATTSGVYYLLLTATEMTCDVAAIIAKSATSDMKTTVATLYPRKLVTVRSGTSAASGGVASGIVLDPSASPIDDYYNGMICIATIDGNVEARMISDYNGTTKVASVVPDWNVAPDSNDTFVIKLPEGAQLPLIDAIYDLLDAEVAAIKAKTDLIPGTQDGKTFAETVLLMAAVLLGKASGLATTTATYRSVDDTVDRVVATVDADGNRSALTYDTSSP